MLIKQNLIIKSLIFTALTLTVFFLFSSSAFAATITVTSNTGDITVDGECNLEEAIQNANDDAQTHTDCLAGSGTDTIVFNLAAGSDTTQIILGSDINYAVSSPIIIDGLSQGTDASCGIEDDLSDRNINIELQGISFILGTGANGVLIQGISMLSDTTNQNIFTAFEESIDGFTLRCSNMGIDASGTISTANVRDQISFENSSNITIGGPNIVDRNIFAHANFDEFSAVIFLDTVDNLTIQNNWFGRGVGPTFPEFSGGTGINVCGPTNCAEDPTSLSTNFLIDNNIFTSDNQGVELNGITGLTFTNNIQSGAEFFGVTIASSSDVEIIGNTSIDNGYGGLVVSEGDTVSVLDNLFSGNGGPGLSLEAVTNATIQGNKIGTDETGMFADSNGKSVLAGGEDPALVLSGVTGVVVGGDQVSERNIISGNDHENSGGGIVIYPNFDTFEPSENITIQGNYIGVGADGEALFNNGVGIFVFGATDTLIGGTSPGEGNIIAGGFSFFEEAFPTIALFSFPFPTAMENISILGNSIYDTGGQPIGFIADTTGDDEPDFFPESIPNDALDIDEGPNAGIDPRNNLNHLLNYPEFTSYETNTTTTEIQYVLDVPAGEYRIEFFQNSILTDYGEGETFLDYQDITHTGGGQQTFTKTLDVEVGDFISATATERGLDGIGGAELTTSTFGATSQFSAAATIQAMAEEQARRQSSSSSSSQASAQQAFSDYYAEEEQQETTTPTPSSNSPQNILNSGQCSADQIISDNMKQGDVDGTYSTYNNGNATEVHLLQAHINRILAQEYNQAAGPVDGFFGPLTHLGVERLQTALNDILQPNPILDIDGIVGPFTRSAVNGSCGGDGLSL